jgi:hypothetical protein
MASTGPGLGTEATVGVALRHAYANLRAAWSVWSALAWRLLEGPQPVTLASRGRNAIRSGSAGW